jgi:hypothetical protein
MSDTWVTLRHTGVVPSGSVLVHSEDLWAALGWTSTPATGATAGSPGSWTPAGALPAASVAACTGLTASPTTAWTAAQYVQTETPGHAGRAVWDGTAWVAYTGT